MNECIFCKIIQGRIPSKKVYDDDRLLAFHDVSPKAPIHILVVPKKHIEKIADLGPEDQSLMGYLMVKLGEIAAHQELHDYRVVINNGAAAGQSVFHVHVHLLGGRTMSWPPG